MKHFLDIAIGAARESGRIQIEHRRNIGAVRLKGAINLVTEVDLLCEEAIKKIITQEFPDHAFLAEEGGEREGRGSSCKWIVDPLDGTTNYAHGFPVYCTSISLEINGAVKLGVIFDPTRDELFTAERGRGAFLNGERISVTRRDALIECMLATGFAYDIHESEVDNIDNFTRFIKHSRAVRRPGAAALDLAYVAAGRLDGFWEMQLKPWDTAAGYLLVQEAGGRVSLFDGDEYSIYKPEILASNGRIHERMVEMLLNYKKLQKN